MARVVGAHLDGWPLALANDLDWYFRFHHPFHYRVNYLPGRRDGPGYLDAVGDSQEVVGASRGGSNGHNKLAVEVPV
jgi:hypothetical protein